MPARSPGGPGRPEATTLPLGTRRFTLEEYHRLGELGVLDEDDPVELLDGQVVAMTPIGPAHASCVRRLTHLLAPLASQGAWLSIQNPVSLGPYDEPQPDVALLRYRADDYAASHPTPADVLLVIEVADTSLERDRDLKLPLYAQAGIPEVWLVNLEAQEIQVYREPTAQGYRAVATVRPGGRLAPQELPGWEIGVSEVLG